MKKFTVVLFALMFLAFTACDQANASTITSANLNLVIEDLAVSVEYPSKDFSSSLAEDSLVITEEEVIITESGIYEFSGDYKNITVNVDKTVDEGIVYLVLDNAKITSENATPINIIEATGVEESEGDTLKGLTQAPIDLKYALTYLKDSEQYSELPTILIGHSWGGFSVSAVSELGLPFEVDGIVSLAGFWQNVNVIEDIAKNYVGETVMLLHPFLVIYEKMIFGENAALNGLDGLSNANAPVLMIHSKDDEVVSFEGNFEVYKEMYGGDPRFTFIEYEDSGHKLTVNADSYERIHDIMHHQVEHDEASEEFLKLNEERLSLIGDFNLSVMNNILDFCDEICVISYE